MEEHSVQLFFDLLCVLGLFFYFLCFKNKPHQRVVILAYSHDVGSWNSMRNHEVLVLCCTQKV